MGGCWRRLGVQPSGCSARLVARFCEQHWLAAAATAVPLPVAELRQPAHANAHSLTQAAEPAEVHWVQCSACEAWRVVPDANWGKIQAADEDADWFCKDADWDLTTTEPHTPACAS